MIMFGVPSLRPWFGCTRAPLESRPLPPNYPFKAASDGLGRCALALRHATEDDISKQLHNRNLRCTWWRMDPPTGNTLGMERRLRNEYRLDELLGWNVDEGICWKIVPSSRTPTKFKLPAGCFLISIKYTSDKSSILRFGRPRSGTEPIQFITLKVEPQNKSGHTVIFSKELLERLCIVQSLPMVLGGPSSALALNLEPILEFTYAVHRDPRFPGFYPALMLKLEGMREWKRWASIGFAPNEPESGRSTTCTNCLRYGKPPVDGKLMASQFLTEALYLASYCNTR